MVWGIWESLGPLLGARDEKGGSAVHVSDLRTFCTCEPQLRNVPLSAKAPTLRTPAFSKCRASAIGRHVSKVRLNHVLHSLLCCADRGSVDGKPVVTEIPSSTEPLVWPRKHTSSLYTSCPRRRQNVSRCQKDDQKLKTRLDCKNGVNKKIKR